MADDQQRRTCAKAWAAEVDATRRALDFALRYAVFIDDRVRTVTP
jgi:hypothetical protein